MNKKKKIKWKSIIVLLFFILFLIGGFVSIFNICIWKFDAINTDEEIKSIQKFVTIKEIADNDNTEIIKGNTAIAKTNPYWDYVNMNLINVDFKDLISKNDESIGWIKVSGTNINYPFVQTNNNNYYLTHSFDKSYNSAGWLFMDYRNSKDFSSKNNIIYAHGRLDKTMFGSLKNTLTDSWLSNSDNFVVKISTEKENSLWQVFSIYHIPTTSDYLKISFKNNNEFLNFNDNLIKRSVYDFKTTVNENDKIITLSTCYGKDERLVLHAKLIKKSAK